MALLLSKALGELELIRNDKIRISEPQATLHGGP